MVKIKLKAVLAEKGIKQKDLVERTGIRQPTLSAMNNNVAKHIPLDVLDKLCEALDCQPADLLEYVPNAVMKRSKGKTRTAWQSRGKGRVIWRRSGAGPFAPCAFVYLFLTAQESR